MERLLRGMAVLAAAFLSAWPWAAATACTFGPEHMPPSGFELVQLSDSIVVATAMEEKLVGEEVVVAFDVGERVKGDAPGRIEVRGSLEDPKPGEPSYVAGPDVIYVGDMCGPGPLRRGRRYLLFLDKDEEGRLRRTGNWSRTAEEYAGEDSDWVRIVRRYVRVQASAAPMAQIAVLERLERRRRGIAGERLNDEEVDDIRDHLGRISPFKPTAYLLSAYAALERGMMPAHTPRARERDLQTMRRRVLTALVTGDHPSAMPLFDRLARQTPEDPDTIGLALRYFARNGDYDRAFRWVETRLMKRLSKLDRRPAYRLMGHVEKMQMGHGEGEEPWRSHARAASVWPELALSLYWYEVRRFGSDAAPNVADAIATIPHDDYRARPLVTLALAADYEDGISQWAVAELRDEKKRLAWEDLPAGAKAQGDDPARLPLQILLSAWESKHGAVLEEVFCQSASRRLALIEEIGATGSALYDWLVQNIAASPLDAGERSVLHRALARWHSRRRREGTGAGDPIAALLKGHKSKGKPIACSADPASPPPGLNAR